MTAQDAWIIYKKIDNEINALQVAPHAYLNFKLKDERKLAIYQQLVDSGVDVEKFFLANCTLNKEFWIDYYKFNPDRCMTYYYSWDEFLIKKRADYFYRVIDELKKGYKLDLNDRDKFLELLPMTDYLLWSALYPEDLELLLSLDDDDWVIFNLPEYRSRMDFIRRVIKGNLVMKRMKGWPLLREKALRIINK
jgi:hypothetical protein